MNPAAIDALRRKINIRDIMDWLYPETQNRSAQSEVAKGSLYHLFTVRITGSLQTQEQTDDDERPAKPHYRSHDPPAKDQRHSERSWKHQPVGLPIAFLRREFSYQGIHGGEVAAGRKAEQYSITSSWCMSRPRHGRPHETCDEQVDNENSFVALASLK